MRNLHMLEATAKALPFLGGNAIVPRSVRDIDSERWFMVASDLVNANGELEE
jgi:hypothetical protein